MGVKYYEQVKSITLLLLVLLSVALTFIIWTYTPDLTTIEKSETEEVSIGVKKEIVEALQPYKAIFRKGNEWKGTTSAVALENIMDSMKNWEASNLLQVNTNVSAQNINEMIQGNNRVTLFFTGDIPFQTFNSALPFTDVNLPEVTFNRMIIDWNKYLFRDLQAFFITDNNDVYRSNISIPNASQFMEKIINPVEEYDTYKEININDSPSLYAIDGKVETNKYTYYLNEFSPELFKKVLFADPSIVLRNVDSATSEKYTDWMAMMTVDTLNKSLNYAYPAAESSSYILPSKLVRDSFNYINEHGGFTADFRLAYMNVESHLVDYQLFLQGLPVYSYETMTRISTIWGENQIFLYRRPYYDLDMFEREMRELPSGEEIIQEIQESNEVELSEIEEIIIGYYLSKDENQKTITLEPDWFYIRNGIWNRVMPKIVGGVENGLE